MSDSINEDPLTINGKLSKLTIRKHLNSLDYLDFKSIFSVMGVSLAVTCDLNLRKLIDAMLTNGLITGSYSETSLLKSNTIDTRSTVAQIIDTVPTANWVRTLRLKGIQEKTIRYLISMGVRDVDGVKLACELWKPDGVINRLTIMRIAQIFDLDIEFPVKMYIHPKSHLADFKTSSKHFESSD